MNKYPLYIPSKGRHEYMITSKALTKMQVYHNVVVEEQEYKLYKDAVIGNKYANILILDMDYKKQYNLCDQFGLTKSTGPGPVRNFIWDHSIKLGYDMHWVMDDNIRCFYYYNNNLVHTAKTGKFWRYMEIFCEKYKNVLMAGPNYEMFVIYSIKNKPITFNTRIYSCNLIKNNIPFRWYGRYNEDTNLSLDILKAGYCTVLFNTFLQKKLTTQTIPGGNTSELYYEGTSLKSEMLYNLHPDVTKLVMRWGRPHHYVDYRPFKKNKLIKIDE